MNRMIDMDPEILGLLGKLDRDELEKLRELADELIRKKKSAGGVEKRTSKRVQVNNLPTAFVIEREKEFFHKEHKGFILDISVGGLSFKGSNPVVDNDHLEVFFRSPSTGEQKKVVCRVLRVKETKNKNTVEFHVAAKGVSAEEIKKYKEWLTKRNP